MLQDLLQTPGFVTGLISLALIIVTALLRDRVGETEADRLLKLGEVASYRAGIVLEAVAAAVIHVEKDLKQNQTMSNDELKQTAVSLTIDILKSQGIQVDETLLRALFALVEKVYQDLKPRFQAEKMKALPA